MSLTEEQPLAGKYSLEMYGRGCWGDMTHDIVSVNSAFVVKRDYIVSGFMRALEDSEVWISPCYRDMDSGNNPSLDSFYFVLSAGKTYRFSFPIQEQKIPQEHNLFLITIRAKGHLLVDNVEFLYRKKERIESPPEAIPVVSPEEAKKLNTESLIFTGLHG